jgi:NAD(P)-dependent dehydrogenase (short-subunit alcohol dehydrogenase family)
LEKEPSEKYVLITGASKGIGKACALRLDRRGFHVFAGVRRESDGTALKQEASTITPVLIDVVKPETIAAARDMVAVQAGSAGLAGLVNNAGVPLGGPLEFLALDDLRNELEINLFGTIAVTQAFLPMLRSARGRIVNMSSISGILSIPFVGPYSATKFALEAISDAWRVELRPWGIRVSIVQPGDVATSIWDETKAIMNKLVKAYPPQIFELYQPIFQIIEGIKEHGIPPDSVAKVVERALLERQPKARYLVGQDAQVFALLRRLPVGIRDWIVARQIPGYR